MKIQLDIPQELNKELKIIKAQRGLKSLEEVIINILNQQIKLETKI